MYFSLYLFTKSQNNFNLYSSLNTTHFSNIIFILETKCKRKNDRSSTFFPHMYYYVSNKFKPTRSLLNDGLFYTLIMRHNN